MKALRQFSRARTLLNNKSFDIPDLAEVNEVGSRSRKNDEIFAQIFESVFESPEAKKNSAGAAINQMFSPSPVFTNKSASTAPISLIEEKSVLGQKTQKLEYLEPIYSHIKSLNSNVAITEYFFKTVIPHFDVNCRKWDSPTVEGPFATKTLGPVFDQCLQSLVELDDPMGALCLFSNVKTMSTEIVDAALIAPVYNTIISLHWEYFRDFKQCLDVVSEMSLRAVPGDAGTANLLHRISSEALDAQSNTHSKETILLWDQRDFKRVNLMLSYRRNIVDALAGSQGFPRASLYS